MLFKKIIRFNHCLIIILFIITIFGFASNPQISFAEISVDSYCQLSIQSLQQEVKNFQELIGIANQYKNDPERFYQLEKVKQIEFKNTKDALFASFGTTSQEYIVYMGENQQKVDTYLIDNPDIKQQIDDLAGQVRALLQEYETLKGSIKKKPPLS